mmetsp:Transcript_17635/g.29792  ORF Transcript_17635/g.29792 Transcript_17635/m.29792 type:complete len:343 (-) Transcript_17635:152-1180(-)
MVTKNYFDANYRHVNYQIVIAIALLQCFQLEYNINTTFCQFFYPTACLYLGATRSLKNYSFVKKEASEGSKPANPLDRYVEALKIPFYSTVAILTVYFIILGNNAYVLDLISLLYLVMVFQVISQQQCEFYTNTFQFMRELDSRPFVIPCTNLTFEGISQVTVSTWVISGYIVYVYFMTRHWFIANVLAISFSIHAVENWIQTHFWQILIIFVGLILYDVSFVFGSDVMMTVAKGFDVPMKILFPLSLPDGSKGFGMLGIGDIIIPGLLASFCLRIDYFRELSIANLRRRLAVTQEQQLDPNEKEVAVESDSRSRFYFLTSLLAYNVGYVVTLIAMYSSNSP